LKPTKTQTPNILSFNIFYYRRGSKYAFAKEDDFRMEN
jgi:hypothetical protein